MRFTITTTLLLLLLQSLAVTPRWIPREFDLVVRDDVNSESLIESLVLEKRRGGGGSSGGGRGGSGGGSGGRSGSGGRGGSSSSGRDGSSGGSNRGGGSSSSSRTRYVITKPGRKRTALKLKLTSAFHAFTVHPTIEEAQHAAAQALVLFTAADTTTPEVLVLRIPQAHVHQRAWRLPSCQLPLWASVLSGSTVSTHTPIPIHTITWISQPTRMRRCLSSACVRSILSADATTIITAPSTIQSSMAPSPPTRVLSRSSMSMGLRLSISMVPCRMVRLPPIRLSRLLWLSRCDIRSDTGLWWLLFRVLFGSSNNVPPMG